MEDLKVRKARNDIDGVKFSHGRSLVEGMKVGCITEE